MRPMTLKRRSALSADVVRFLTAGVVNSGLTILIYQGLLFAVSPGLAYSVAWICGLVLVALVYPDWVFKGGRRRWMDRAGIAASYVIVFLFGLLILHLAQAVGISARISVFVVVALTATLNFFVSRSILRRRDK